MAKPANVTAAVDPELKRAAERVFSELGLTAAEAVTLFYEQVAVQRNLPFPVRMPNAETIAAIDEARNGKGLSGYARFDELVRDIN